MSETLQRVAILDDPTIAKVAMAKLEALRRAALNHNEAAQAELEAEREESQRRQSIQRVGPPQNRAQRRAQNAELRKAARKLKKAAAGRDTITVEIDGKQYLLERKKP